jgi:hypothetical protein
MRISPFQTPEAFDYIEIDDVKSPTTDAKIVRTAINGRELDYDEQRSPLFLGVFTVIRTQKIVSIDYAIEYWSDAAIDAAEAWQRMLRAHQKQAALGGTDPLARRSVKPLKVLDPALDGLDVPSMWCPYVGPRFERVEGMQAWRLPFKLREFGPRRPIGGPMRDERNAGAINAARREAEQAQREAIENVDKWVKRLGG